MALNPETIVWARIGVSDMLLTACGGAVVLFGVQSSNQPSTRVPSPLPHADRPVSIIPPSQTPCPCIPSRIQFWRSRCLVCPVRSDSGEWAYINSFFGITTWNALPAPSITMGSLVLSLSSGAAILPLVNLLAGGDCTAAIWQRAHWRSNDRSTQLGLFARSGLWGVLVFILPPPLASAAINASGGYPGGAAMERGTKGKGKAKGKRQNFSS